LNGVKSHTTKTVELDEELIKNTQAARDFVQNINRLDDQAVGTFLTGLVQGFQV